MIKLSRPTTAAGHLVWLCTACGASYSFETERARLDRHAATHATGSLDTPKAQRTSAPRGPYRRRVAP